MKIDGWRWWLKVEVFRFGFCFHWIMFFISWELGFRFISFIYLVFFRSITIFTFHLILNDHIWSFFLFFEPTLFMFWLQNRYKSSILKPSNQFYLLFGYKVPIGTRTRKYSGLYRFFGDLLNPTRTR